MDGLGLVRGSWLRRQRDYNWIIDSKLIEETCLLYLTDSARIRELCMTETGYSRLQETNCVIRFD